MKKKKSEEENVVIKEKLSKIMLKEKKNRMQNTNPKIKYNKINKNKIKLF